MPAALDAKLAPIYLISGDEPLTAGEAADAVRAAARKAGFTERIVFAVDRSFAWDELRQAAQEMSLFAERRLFELRMPSGKPDKGAALLAGLASTPPPDVLCLIVTGKLDAKTSDSPWVRAIERAGVWVRVWPVGRAALPAWLEGRARALGLRLAPGVAQSIADRVEGNLLAAKQELDMLALLANGAAIDADLVMRAIGDSARYDVLAARRGRGRGRCAARAASAHGTAQRGRGAGTHPVGAAARAARHVPGARGPAHGLAAGRERVESGGSSLRRARSADCASCRWSVSWCRHHGRTGSSRASPSGDAWSAITALTAELAGALQAHPDSGRVPR